MASIAQAAAVLGAAPDSAPTKRVAVSVRNVSMAFPGVRAVEDASFDLAEGTFLTILGPSGSGKTTLLRMIAGFLKPTSGEIVVGGRPVQEAPPHRRSIGMVFQKLALFPHMTAEENVAFPLKMRRFDARAIPVRVRGALDLVRLGGLGGRRIQELSGGQQQRVAIARALVFEPDLLLLDEPLAALDRKLREEMQLEFRRIQRELGVTTINVTHDQREALIMSDAIVVMDKGRIQQMARPSSTYREPANAFVAGFVGVTNVLPGTVRAVSGETVELSVAGARLPGRAAGTPRPRAGEAADGNLRAEQIRISGRRSDLAALDSCVPGTVEDVIFEGERVVYEVRAEALAGLTLRVFDHDPAQHTEFERGAGVHLGWNARDLLVFAHPSGTAGPLEEDRT
jgi:putative spermidine/putrescine transport system ATP-binding protein